jgi:DNA polymerase elongation subunit (family B)
MMKLEIIANNIGMANVCSVPFSYIFMRGQGIKIFSLVAKQCKQDDFVIPTLNKGKVGEVDENEPEDEEGYEGAIVLEPKTGIYTEDPVSVLDYASLYPSSMISENLSHDCLVERGSKYDNLPGVEYLDINYDIYEKVNEKKVKIAEKTCRFTQNEKGVIPRILMTLLRKRKETRKKAEYQTVMTTNGDRLVGLYSEDSDSEMIVLKTVEGKVSKCLKSEFVSKVDTYDDFTKAVLDGLQNAYKVTANSLYGQIGAKTSQIYLKDIAACTTATGRNMILKAKSFLEDNYMGINIVYGDSVTGYTPTIVRYEGNIYVEKFENIAPRFGGDVWIPCTEQGKQTKEGCELVGLDVWTDDGWTRVHRIIRHQLASHKRIIRVATHTGVVDVTDEHSLLRKDRSKVTPQECQVGDELLHNDMPTLIEMVNTIGVEEARIMGMFCGDGSCGIYNCPSGKKSSWAINNSDYTLLSYYQSLCEKAYPEYEWKILDTLASSGVYKLVAKGNSYGAIVKLVETYRNKVYSDQEKIVPQEILCSSQEVRQSFWDGLYDADGIKKNETGTRIDQKNQISAATFALLGSSLGYKVSINTRTDKPNIYRLTLTVDKQRRNPDAIKKMYPIEYQGYVYDFTTDNHRFQSGIGRLIVSNTDSIFCAFPMEYTDENGVVRKRTGQEAVQHAINMGIDASSKFKKYLKPPHDLEYEKTFYPFILISKKRYCALKYEHDPTKCKFNSMGIALKRRDNAPIVKTVYGGVIDIIMHKQDVGESIAFLKKSIQELIDGKHPLESLIISKSLKSDYKDPTRIAHKALADRMGERDPGNKPQVNDRIPYVYVDISEIEKQAKKAKKKILQGDRIEHPDYIRKAELKPDYEFYITNQIMKPVSQIYALVLEKMPGYKKGATYFEEQEKKLIVDKGGDMKKVKDKIADMREAEVQEILFKPFLTKLQNKRENLREITDWFKRI